jgi:hypothetical protein
MRHALSVMALLFVFGCGDSETHNGGAPETPNGGNPAAPSRCQVDWGAGSGDSNPALVARAQQMLAEHGVTIADAKGDWIWTGHREDNPSPYPVPFADLTGVRFAVDADYLYVLLSVNGAYPRSESELPRYGQDQIRKLNVNIGLDTDNDKNTGSPGDNGSEVMLGTGMLTTPTCGWMDVYDFWYGPTGLEPEDRRWTHRDNRNLVVAAWGGAGADHRVIIYPVALLGVRPGQTIAVNGWDECASLKYPERHATFDVLGPSGVASHVVIRLPE